MDWQALLDGTQAAVTSIVAMLLSGFAILLGAIFIFSGISKMLAHARGERQGQATAGPVAINMFIGALLIQLPWTIQILSETMFNAGMQQPNNAMQYMPNPVNENKMLAQLVEVGVWWVYCIGFVAIIRGFVLWNALASGNSRGQDSGWKGFFHIFFGAMAVNLTEVLKMFTSGG